MTRFSTLIVGCLTALTPALAPAALRLRFEQFDFLPVPGTYGIDVYAAPTDADDEQLWVYDIGFTLQPFNPSAPRSLSFVAPYAEKPEGGFVFGDRPVTYEVQNNPAPGAGAFLLTVQAQDTNDLPDIVSEVIVARVFIDYHGPAPLAPHVLRFDPQLTAFASGDTTRLDPTIPFVAEDMVIFVPEPSAAAFVAFAGVLALRRRRLAIG